MSAFIVENKIINRVVAWVRRESNDHHWIREDVSKAAGLCQFDDHWEEKLGAAMFLLNCTAVAVRYGERASNHPPYTWRMEWSSTVQTFKHLECWLYQCSEGDIPETNELHKTFHELKGWLASKIVSALPAYQQAEW